METMGMRVRGIAALVVLLTAGRLVAEEPVGAFLDALRGERYFEVALSYLDRMGSSPLASAEFREQVDYQRGVTLVQAAVLERNRATRERRLNEARSSLEKFLKEHPQHPKAGSARRQFGNLLVEWARMKVEQAERTNDATQRQEAAKLYDQAYAIFDHARQELKEKLAGLKGSRYPGGESQSTDLRDAMRADYLDAQLQAAQILESKADTAGPQSAERKKQLEEAVKTYDTLYNKYPTRLAGLRARFYQARTLVKLSRPDQALPLLTKDILALNENSPVFRELKTRGTLLALDCWLDPSQKKYTEAISRASSWLDQIRTAEHANPEWVQLRLALAKAHRAYAAQLKAKNAKDEQISRSLNEARRLARAASRIAGPYQDEARALLASLPGGIAVAREPEKEPPKTYAEAKARGEEAISTIQEAEVIIASVPARLKKETNDEVRAELQKALQQARASIGTGRTQAIEYFQLAQRLADAETPVEDLNMVLYYLAYLHYSQGDYYEAAVIGEFVGRRFPGSPGAAKDAQIALASYLKLYAENTAQDRTFETDHILSIANYIVNTWSGQPEAAEAINTMIPFLIQQGKLDEARQYVENIPATSPQRGVAELRIGQALWRDYLTGLDEVRAWKEAANEPNADKAAIEAKVASRQGELDALRDSALEILQSGVERMRGAESIDETVLRAVLTLAQIYVDTDRADEALPLLDDAKIGPLPLIERNEAVIRSTEMRELAYRVALGAFVAALPKSSDAVERSKLIDRIRGAITALKQQVGESAEGQKRLVSIFFSLARGLERQIKLLNTPQDRRVLSEGFDSFLDQVRREATDVGILNWVAESYSSLGSGLAGDRGSAEIARKYFDASIETYDKILDDAERLKLTAEQLRQLRIRKALTQRESRQFEAAAKLFYTVLKEDSRKLATQVEAAKTYQQWGAVPQQARRYLEAINGAYPKTSKRDNVIWGWSRIARVTQRYRQYRDTFHEARYNMAFCHYKFALRLRKKTDRERYLKLAKTDIQFTQKLYPTMGGAAWRGKYDALLKQIQRALQETPTGLGRLANKKH